MRKTVALDDTSAGLVLPAFILPWLRAVVVFAFLSLVTTSCLVFVLAYKLVRWRLKSKQSNQFIILIFNLVCADLLQSLAFFLNVEWLRVGSVQVGTRLCFLQGTLISTGDLSSGVWCFVIALHTFASVILDYRLKPRPFYLAIFLSWAFIHVISWIGPGLYPHNYYVRSGVWCWIHHDLTNIRLWTHYFWIFVFEFGNVVLYTMIYTILSLRIRRGFYTPEEATRVRSIANLMVVYPLVYVVCTIPLASARMGTMSGHNPSWRRLCLAAAMITSNGWLDVLLYTCTRRIVIFSDEPPPEDLGVDTFSTFWKDGPRRFGGECTIEATQPPRRRGKTGVALPSHTESSDDLCANNENDIKMVMTTQVTSEPAQPEDFEEMDVGAMRKHPASPTCRWSEDTSDSSRSLKELPHSHSHPHSRR